MIYLFVLIFLLLCAALLDRKVDKRLQKLGYALAYIILIILLTLRFRVGGDSLFYQDAFATMPDLKGLSRLDLLLLDYQPLWYLLTAIVKSTIDDFMFFQFIHAVIINTAIFYLIPKYTERKFLAVLVYYIVFYLYFGTEILRESLAVIVFLFAYPLIFKKKYISYYLLCFVAYLFHAFAMFTFLVPALVYVFRKPIKLYHMLAIAIITALAPSIISNVIINLFDFSPYISRQIRYYTELEININGILKNLFDVMPVFLVMLLQRKYNRVDPILIPAVNMYFITILLSVSIAGALRLSNYFVFFFYIALINTFLSHQQFKIPEFRTQLLMIVILLIISKSFYYMRDMSRYNYGYPAHFYNLYLPYNSVFDPEINRTRENIFRKSMDESINR